MHGEVDVGETDWMIGVDAHDFVDEKLWISVKSSRLLGLHHTKLEFRIDQEDEAAIVYVSS